MMDMPFAWWADKLESSDRYGMARMKTTVNKLGPFIVVEGDVEGVKYFWVERGGVRVSGYGSIDDAKEHASLLYEEYVADADVSTGE
jgi:hypothetical protein